VQRIRRFAGLLAAGTAAGLLGLVLPATPAAADECAQPGEAYRPVPWPQQMLAPERAWQFSRGGGQTVAVLDSGVDGNQPQLRGHVKEGTNFITGKDPHGNTDCTGHGTAVAGIIAAQSSADVAFHGIAPDATILPVRVSEDTDSNGPGNRSATPTQFADAINWAVNSGARIVNISMVMYEDNPAVRGAIVNAISKKVVVVAAVGNQGGAQQENKTPYPAAYDGVIGVGAVDFAGNRWTGSQHGPYVDLVAPGSGVITTQRGSGLVPKDGTSFATAFVSAAAALVLARWPTLGADDVARRLTATATPAPGDMNSGEYGHGIVNPYAAVTERMVDDSPAPLPAMTPEPPTEDQVARAAAWSRSTRLSLILSGVALLVLVAVAGGALAIPRGHRRRWRAGLAAPPRERRQDTEPAPPVHLFDGD